MSDERENPHEAKTRAGESGPHERPTTAPTGAGPASAEFPVPDWDRYRFIAFIGEGGMGRVYKALDPKLNRHVALKFLRGDDPAGVERFAREARAQAQIEHDHVCKVYETGEIEGRLYIAMQYIDGLTLTRLRDQLTLEQKVKLIEECAEGIQAAHRLGLIHRDIKPGNIMVEKKENGWHPYVLDFGLAREIQAQSITMTGAMVGTPGYMAPEQAWGDFRRLDRRMDVYSLGATLYFLLGGMSPFEGESTMVTLRKMLQEEPKPLKDVAANVPEDLEIIVMKCLEKEPERRYDSARALAEDLNRWLDGEPVQARRASIGYRLAKKARKNRALVAVSALALLAIGALTVYGIRTTLQARERAALAQRFGQQVERIDTITRIGHTIPLHDTRGERRWIESQLSEISSKMNEVGAAGRGPGNYALGRGAMALDKLDDARRYLEASWNAGFQESEVAYALGLTLGRIYQRELESVENVRNKDVREARRKEVERQYRDPAVNYLRASRNYSAAAPEYAEGLIALYEKRYDEGLRKASEAVKRLPWLYEAFLLEGNIYTALANAKRGAGDNQGALEQYTKAGSAYRSAVRIGESDGEAYECLCALSLNRMYTRIYSTGGDLTADVEEAKAACGKALQADPDRASAYNKVSNVYWVQATSQNLSGDDPRPALLLAVEAARNAIRLEPAGALAYKNLGTAYQLLGNNDLHAGKDPTNSLNEAIRSYHKAMDSNPADITVYNSLGNTYAIQGDRERDEGRDPRKHYRESIETFEKGIAINPQFAFIYSNLGVTYKDLSLYEESHGMDPEPNMKAAIENYRKCLELKPDDNFAWNNLANGYKNLAQHYLRTGRDPTGFIDQGLKALETPLRINPDYSTQYSNLGDLHKLRGEFLIVKGADPRASFQESEKAYQREMFLKKNDAGSQLDLAGAYLSIAQFEFNHGLPGKTLISAEDLVRKSLALDSSRKDFALQRLAQIKLLHARFLARDGRPAEKAFQDANTAMKEALKENADNAFVWRDAAKLAWRDAESRNTPPAALLQEGLAAADRALHINGRFAEAFAIRGKLYRMLARADNAGDNDRLAKESMAHAFKLNPYLAREYND